MARDNIAALPQLRGTARLHPCEVCQELHPSSGSLAGFPILRCPSVTPPNAMHLKVRQIVVGAERDDEATEPVIVENAERPRRKA